MQQGTRLVKEWKILFTKESKKDALKLQSVGLKEKTKYLLEILKKDPFATLPTYEKLSGDLVGNYSRRINIKHRLVYQVFKKERIVKVIRMWTHYDEN